jgi:histidinol phosphatase-like PHP family hydrolase
VTNWRPTDCHAHSTHSDGALTVEEVASRGHALGIRPSVSDHISRDAPTTVNSITAIEHYLDDLEQHDVLRGGEFCWHDSLWREMPPHVTRRFTHRIGSLHSIRLTRGGYCRAFVTVLPADLTADQYVESHVVSLEALAEEMPVDILAHPTLLPPPLRPRDPHELWTEAREERMIAALKKNGIAFEVSARYTPHERIVRRAIDAGVRISLGSDGHSRAQVGDIVRPLATTRALGVPDAELYDPAVHGSRTASSA